MPDFLTLYNTYENTDNVCKFCDDYRENDAAIRFLLVRSLDKANLKDIIRSYSTASSDGNIKTLTEKAFYSAASISQIIEYIENKRTELLRQREAELEGLEAVLSSIPVLNCGIRNDKIDDIVQSFVRNKSLKTLDELYNELDHTVLPRVRQYSMWSYYNQTSNDIIELFFLKHHAIIPTLRKIKNVDFFLKVGDAIIPFDLKITHISDGYFDLASQGILRDANPEHYDDFCVQELPEENEMKRIKTFYRSAKRTLNLPDMAGLDKNALCEKLLASENEGAVQFVEEMMQAHEAYVPADYDACRPLEWWNYKYQGERLFCNNNRIFVFFAYKHRFVDGKELKGKTAEIQDKINNMLDNITALEDIHTVNYHYC